MNLCKRWYVVSVTHMIDMPLVPYIIFLGNVQFYCLIPQLVLSFGLIRLFFRALELQCQTAVADYRSVQLVIKLIKLPRIGRHCVITKFSDGAFSHQWPPMLYYLIF